MDKGFWIGVAIFFVLQLVNVILSTMRTILTVKANRHIAAVITAISYTFYSGVVKLMTAQEMWVVLSVTFITNIIGVYVANFILDKTTKDKLWVFCATIKKRYVDDICTIVNVLDQMGIKCVYEDVSDRLYTIQIFAYTQKQSNVIIPLLKNYGIKYYVVESRA